MGVIRSKPLRVLAILPGLSPSALLTVVKPLAALHRAGEIIADFTLEAWVSSRQLERADIVVFNRNTEPYYGTILEQVLTLGKPVIYDLDDNFFELPLFYQNELPYRTESYTIQLERYLTSANLVRVYSNALRGKVLQLNPQVVRIKGSVDFSLLPASPPLRDPNRVRIVYATSRSTKDDLADLFLEDLKEILSVYREKVEVFFWGYHPSTLRGHPSVRFLDFIPDYDRFFKIFARFGFDIGLAPLRDEVFYRSKSNNKFREYGACRIAGIYSNIEVYSQCITHGQTGLLVSHRPEAWFKAISHLIENPALREGIQEQACQFVREHYRLEDASTTWLSHLQEVARKHSASILTHHPTRPTHHVDPSSSIVLERSSSILTWFLRLVKLGARMIGHLKAHGLVPTVKKVQRFLTELYMLMRMKWFLVGSRLRKYRQ